ncbi:hypothetical protein K456DRAFT_42170 [Colletotrichum gloeosporioides 23]|nr:hypothetical protein K456DRAFT_42170 [Colletotrichum gloeosporioides 23]
MSSENPYPPYGSSLREAKLQLWMQGSEFDRERLRRHFRLTIIEDPSLANVSPENIRQKFMKWVSSLPPGGDQPGGDQQGEAINAEQPQVHSGAEVEDDDADDEADKSENNDDEENEDDENNGHQEVTDDPEFYWMLVTCRYLAVWWEIMGLGGQWERQSSYPQKRPWKET